MRLMEAAAAMEQVMVHAESIGLTREDVREIITTWQQTPWEVTPNDLRRLVTARAIGLPWMPPKHP